MNWLLFVLGAVLSWGIYGPMLHQGQVALGNPLQRALVRRRRLLPDRRAGAGADARRPGPARRLRPSRRASTATSRARSARSARVCIILAFRAGGIAAYVMPLVFGGAPLVNVLVSMALHPPRTAPSPMLYLGFLLAALGAYMVLYFKPQS